MERLRGQFSVSAMCRVFEVSRSGYYAWRPRAKSRRAKENEALTGQIKAVFTESWQTYGSPRIFRELRARGVGCGRHRVARLMRRAGLRALVRRRYRATTDSAHSLPVCKNLLGRAFQVEQPNRVWASDITYIATEAGWMYLAVVLDLCSRRVVGWSMKPTLERELVLGALHMALGARAVRKGLLHHSDRGSQYASWDYQRLLEKAGLRASMSGRGNCYDNAVVESFFATLKKELIHRRRYRTREEARADIFEYIEVFYNRKRLHSTLGYRSPVAYEADLARRRAA